MTKSIFSYVTLFAFAIAPLNAAKDTDHKDAPKVESKKEKQEPQMLTDKLEAKYVGVRPAKKGGNSAVYMELRNTGDQAAVIESASFADASKTELHKTTFSKGVHAMRPLKKLEVKAGKTLKLKPGGLHIMLINLSKDLSMGDAVEVELTFKGGAKAKVKGLVKKCCHECHG